MNKSFNELKIFWKNKKVFLTGHTGFKGSWLSILLNILEAQIYGYSLKAENQSLFNQAKCYKIMKKNYFLNVNNLNKLKKKNTRNKTRYNFSSCGTATCTRLIKKTNRDI